MHGSGRAHLRPLTTAVAFAPISAILIFNWQASVSAWQRASPLPLEGTLERYPRRRHPRTSAKHAPIAMHALWSRAARTPGTRTCLQCASNPNGLARRAGAVSVKGPGQESAEPDERPARAYHDLDVDDETLGDRTHARLRQLFPDGIPWARIHDIVSMPLAENPPAQRSEDSLGDAALVRLQSYSPVTDPLWNLLQHDSRFPGTQTLDWHVNTGPALIRHHLPPQSLWSYDHVRETALKKRQTWKKLAIQELSIGTLILSLIGFARSQLRPDSDLAHLSPSIWRIARLPKKDLQQLRKEMLAHIKYIQALSTDPSEADMLEAKSLTSLFALTKPNYFQDEDGDFYHIARKMNLAIRRHLKVTKDEWKLSAVALNLANTAHNLLVSSAAPDVQTFNLLISALKRYNLPVMADQVIDALDACKIRPNELTCAVILDHYVRTRRPQHFSRFVAKMRGLGGTLMLATPDININEAGEARLIRIHESKVFQKVHPTSLVFNTLMMGVLRFAGIDRALEIYFEMKADGWGLTVTALSQFLLDCIHQSDWQSGLWIWQEICSIKATTKSQHMAKAYTNMLCLCAVTSNTTVFNHVLKEVVDAGQDRQMILKKAMSLAESVRGVAKAQERGKGYAYSSPPAWTSDNVMIAVSGPKDDTISSTERVASVAADLPSAWDPGMNNDTESDMELVSDFTTGKPLQPEATSRTQSESSPPEHSDVVWSAWLQHELGELQTSKIILESSNARMRDAGTNVVSEKKDPMDKDHHADGSWLKHNTDGYSSSPKG